MSPWFRASTERQARDQDNLFEFTRGRLKNHTVESQKEEVRRCVNNYHNNNKCPINRNQSDQATQLGAFATVRLPFTRVKAGGQSTGPTVHASKWRVVYTTHSPRERKAGSPQDPRSARAERERAVAKMPQVKRTTLTPVQPDVYPSAGRAGL